ncbi:MAG: peptidoglycan-associated lipoprotein Pal [Ghiorsea sp.]
MISKHYSKMALVAVAAASLVFAGCGGKKDDATMDSHAGKGGMETSSSNDMNGNMGNKNAGMDNNGSGKVVMKPSTNSVSFAFDSAAINSAGQMILSEYSAWLNANTDVKVTVEGNGDERGSREYNLALGDKRANSVRSALVANGVAQSRIDTVSFGEERPVCTQSGEACWAQNRRGDIVNR